MAKPAHQTLQAIHDSIEKLRAVQNLDLLDKPLQYITTAVCPAHNWLLLLREDEEKDYRIQFASAGGQVLRKLQNVEITLRKGLLKSAIDHNKILYTEDIRHDTRFGGAYDSLWGKDFVHGPSFVVPLQGAEHQQVIGILGLYGIRLTEPSAYYQDILCIISSTLAFAIEHLQRVRTFKHQALTDHLTGLYNRRALTAIVEREIEQCLRYERPISLVVIDVDNFKSINDTEGHLYGDAVLVQIGKILSKSVRLLDYITRFAGDEFVLLMPDTVQSQLAEVINRVKNNFEVEKLVSKVPYSISIGYYSGPPRSLQEMFSIADKMMYKQKTEHKHMATT